MNNANINKLKVTVLCGGPSLERGISLNSARSVSDHLPPEQFDLAYVYFSRTLAPYLLTRPQLYSNTPSDFDFKLARISSPLSPEDLDRTLIEGDLAFPLIHGKFGEDGTIQRLLERSAARWIGPDADTCERCFDKALAQAELERMGLPILPFLSLGIGDRQIESRIAEFFSKHDLDRVVVKPARGGSSIGVSAASTPAEAAVAAKRIFAEQIDDRFLVETYCRGTEFTIIVLQNEDGEPVPLLPTEIELLSSEKNRIFSYRAKYLATNQTIYHSPPRFPEESVGEIRRLAAEIFRHFNMRDFVRLDGWHLPDGQIWFSDINPISGMEQNSFFFLQAAQMGMSHRDALERVVRSACRRESLVFPEREEAKAATGRERCSVLFGGATAERQVSIMSGTNVWLKLRGSAAYEPVPYFLDTAGKVWELPYALALYHTTEEIKALCETAVKREEEITPWREVIQRELAGTGENFSVKEFLPQRLTLAEFIDQSHLVFIALHGGMGENGELQALLEKTCTEYTGSGPEASAICMNKLHTAELLQGLEGEGIYTARKVALDTAKLSQFSPADFAAFYAQLGRDLGLNENKETVLIKPNDDGCSAGVARLASADDLQRYVAAVLRGDSQIYPGTLTLENSIIEMPTKIPEILLCEEFIVTDEVRVHGSELRWTHHSGWIEITTGMVGAEGVMRALNPSLTVAAGNILSLEEKFQGGTGINITPPPEEFVSPEVIVGAKKRMETVARHLLLNGFSRIDSFLNIRTGEVCVIEVNTIPGLTPSTVIYQQALTESSPVYPRDFLEVILSKRRSFRRP